MTQTRLEQGKGLCPPEITIETWEKLLSTMDRVLGVDGKAHITWGPDYYELSPQKRAEAMITVYESMEDTSNLTPLKFNDSKLKEIGWEDECDTSKCPFPCQCRGEETEESKRMGEFVVAQMNAAIDHWNPENNR